MTQMPNFRQEVVSSSRYPIDKESLCYNFIVWKLLVEMVSYKVDDVYYTSQEQLLIGQIWQI